MLQRVAYEKAEMQMEPRNNSCNHCRDAAPAVLNVQSNGIFFTSARKTANKHQHKVGRQPEVMAAVRFGCSAREL